MADTVEQASENGPSVVDVDALPDAGSKPVIWAGRHYPTAADFPSGDCHVGEGSSLIADPADPAWLWVVDNCRFDKGVKVVLADTPAPTPLPKKKEAQLQEPSVEQQKEVVPPQDPPVLLAANESVAPEQPVAKTVESVGVDAAIGQVKSLLPADASAGVLVGGAATLAVVGAAIKLGPSMLKARAEKSKLEHEREMRKLEVEEKKTEQNDEQHKQCGLARMALEAKVAEQATQISALSAKLSEVEAKASSKEDTGFDLSDFNPEDVKERLEQLEKLLKKAAPAKKPGRAKKNA